MSRATTSSHASPAAPRASRSAGIAARLTAPAIGTVAVGTVALVVAADLRTSVLAVGLAAVALTSVAPRSSVAVGVLVTLVLGGAALAATVNRLSLPAACGLGVLLLGYLLATELTDPVDHRGQLRVTVTGLTVWLSGIAPLLAAGAGSGAVVAVTVAVIPTEAGGWLAFAGPPALFVAVLLAVGELRRQPRT